MSKNEKTFWAVALCIGVIIALCVGCQTPASKVVYNTLATVEATTAMAFEGYLDAVAKGKASTNSVPAVTAKYKTFRVVFTAAVEVAAGNKAATAPASIESAAQDVMLAITAAKGN